MEAAFMLVIFEDLVQAAFQLIHRYTPSAGLKFVDNQRLLAIKKLLRLHKLKLE